jgi:hypothetical protein
MYVYCLTIYNFYCSSNCKNMHASAVSHTFSCDVKSCEVKKMDVMSSPVSQTCFLTTENSIKFSSYYPIVYGCVAPKMDDYRIKS